MTPREKAVELFRTLYQVRSNAGSDITKFFAKQSAMIVVKEIIKSRKEDLNFDDTLISTGSEYYTPHPMYLTYWNLVKEEIEKL
jgi:hypothetical protein